MADDAPAPGLLGSLRRFAATLLALVHTRLELVAVEVEEQLEHVARLLLWGVAAVYFAGIALLLLAFTVVLAFWDGHRLLAAGLVTLAVALLALVAALRARAHLRNRPHFLEATARALEDDAAALDGEPR